MSASKLNSIINSLKKDGWNLNEEKLADMFEGKNINLSAVLTDLLNSDIKDYGLPILINQQKEKITNLSSPIVLQVSKVRNISAPKANEESGAAPRLLKVTLTDGTSYIQGIEYDHVKDLSLKTTPGTKIKLSPKMSINGSIYYLTPGNTTRLGGKVEELFEKWKLSQSVSKFSRAAVSADGQNPPPWVPFGQKIHKEQEVIKSFKALGDGVTKVKEDAEFEAQRQQTLQELAKEGNKKVFGGGKQMLDSNVQRVMKAGYSAEEAQWALNKCRNDINKAIKELKVSSGAYPGRGPPSPIESYASSRVGSRGVWSRGSRGGREGGPDGSDDEVIPQHIPKQVTLFDFVKSKMVEKNEHQLQVTTDMEDRPGRGHGGRETRGRGRGRGRERNYENHKQNAPPSEVERELWPAPGEQSVLEAEAYSSQAQHYCEKQINGGAISRQREAADASTGGAAGVKNKVFDSKRSIYNNSISYNTGRQRNYSYDNGSFKINDHGYDYGNHSYNNGCHGYDQEYHDRHDYHYSSRPQHYNDSNYEYSDGSHYEHYNHYYSGNRVGYGGSRRGRGSGGYNRGHKGGGGDDSSYYGWQDYSYGNEYRQPHHQHHNAYSSNYRGSTCNYRINSFRGNNHYTSGIHYKNNGFSGGRASRDKMGNQRSHKEMKLIAQFEQSMTMAGIYEPNEMNFGQSRPEGRQRGSLEFHRGSRRGIGRRY